MRVAVSVENDHGLEASVSPHFGRCPFYALIDVENDQIVAVSTVANPHYPQHVPGAIPQFIRDQNANVMLTGGMGYRAVTFFNEFGIQPVTGASGTVKQAVSALLTGQLAGYAPCHESVSDCHGDHEHAG